MNKVSNNTHHQKLNVTIYQNTYQTNVNAVSKENAIEKIKSTDTIEINEKNENIINTKKAYDAFKDAYSDFGYVATCNGCGADMSLYYNRVLDDMQSHGISVPSFIPDAQNGNSFLRFIDTVKDYARNLSVTNPDFLPSSFLDFCDSYKNKLMQYDCK